MTMVHTMQRRWRANWTGVALCCALAGPVLVQTAPAPAASTPTARPVLSVTLVQPRTQTLPLTLPATGTVQAWQEAVIGAEINGLALREVRVNVGDAVKRGQVLALMQADTLRAELAQAQASLAEAQALAQEARAQAERARSLQQQGFFSTAQLSQAVASEAQAAARVQSLRAQADLHQLRLAQAEVRAPDDGIISARLTSVGQVPGPGAELFRLIRQGRLEWRAEVTAAELPRIRAGASVTVQAPGGGQMTGQVRMVAPTLDPASRNALVYVDLKGQHPAVRVGTYVRGELQLGQSQAMTLPQSAVVVREGFSYVYELTEGDRVAQRKVQTGRLVQGQMEILSGLASGARVVASGGAFLNQGDRVRVVTP